MSSRAAPALAAQARVPLLRNYDFRRGRLVRKTISTRKVMRATPRASLGSNAADKDPGQCSLKEMFCRNAGRELEITTATQDCDKADDGKSACAQLVADAFKYIEGIKRDIDSGVLLLNGDPWVRPCDAHIEAARINFSRNQSATQALDAAEVRDLVFRPAVFVWAPHLLQLWPLYCRDVGLCVCVCLCPRLCVCVCLCVSACVDRF